MQSSVTASVPPRRVLLLDDEESVLGVLSDYLRQPGLEIVTCREIEAAEAILEHHSFDVVVTDLRVSELGGLEGIRLIRFVTTHFPDTVVLAMSGYVTEEVYAFGRAAGVTAVLEKPLDLPRLREWVLGRADVDDSLIASDDGEVADVQPLSEFIRDRQVYAVYQPIVDLSDPDPFKVFAYEALARGPGDTPLRNPEILFAYATRKECLLDTDLMCIEAAAASAGALGDARLFFNIHPRSLTAADSPSRIESAATSAGLRPQNVVIEITEHHAIVNPSAFAACLDKLRKSGFRIALDDFGVGYANVRLLSEIRPDFIKLSGYFAQDVGADDTRQALIASMVDMADRLGVPVIAEAIESQSDLDIVRALGVHYGQGYFFAKPAAPEKQRQRFGVDFAAELGKTWNFKIP